MAEDKRIVLAEDELELVSGGRGASAGAKAAENENPPSTTTHYCIKCKKDTVHIVYSGTRMVCKECGATPTL